MRPRTSVGQLDAPRVDSQYPGPMTQDSFLYPQLNEGRFRAGIATKQHNEVPALQFGKGTQGESASRHTSHVVDTIAANHRPHKALEEIVGFVGNTRGAYTGDSPWTRVLDNLGKATCHEVKCLIPASRFQSTRAPDQRRGQPFRVIHKGMSKAAFVTDPGIIDLHVLARCNASQFVVLDAQYHVTAHGTQWTDAVGVGQLPDPGFEAKDTAGQGAHRADVNRIALPLAPQRVLGRALPALARWCAVGGGINARAGPTTK